MANFLSIRQLQLFSENIVNAPRAILRFPIFCDHAPVKMRTISHSPFGLAASTSAVVDAPLFPCAVLLTVITPILPHSITPRKLLRMFPIPPMTPMLPDSITTFPLQNRFYPPPQILAHQRLDRIVPHLPALVVQPSQSDPIQANPSHLRLFKAIQGSEFFRGRAPSPSHVVPLGARQLPARHSFRATAGKS